MTHIKKLFLEINELWCVLIEDIDWSDTQFPVYIQTESEIKLYEKEKSKQNEYIIHQVRDIKNKPSIEEIFKNKNQYVGQKLKLNGFLVRKSFKRPNDNYCVIEYTLHDKTGSIPFIKLHFKKHFWQKVPKSRGMKILKEGKYEIEGIFTKDNHFYYLIMKNERPLRKS
ncbi:MAG: hypothetical protein DRN71_01820 [Candidatus Nanohalarchaeota archaeon]|nr:MAG: hypothetical protein DRN71_01820 [Candidatus Nanohaloarchaeota archaeon]